jgi:hypothetical protein
MMVNDEAYFFRETARTVAVALARQHIAHLISGSLAVREYGYPGVPLEVDFIVPDVQQAAKCLTSDPCGHLVRVPEIQDRLQDNRNGVIIDLRLAGKVLKTGCKVPFPAPTSASDRLQFITLEELISLKLDSWANSPVRRLRDKTDVIELIARRNLTRGLAIQTAVRQIYVETWDALQAEK